ncbi:hypothetical protein LIER_19434 [Lithospermum erythrorhizon]|uniref:Gag-pol polyprotein n=1 Tax=Lithospermum erythrorhizon TaxID=34254 RepID=A0AAV3QIT7_LITER
MEGNKEGSCISCPPQLDGTHYPYWKVKMTAFLRWTAPRQNNAEGVAVVKKEANWTNDEAKLSLGNNKTWNAILCVVDVEVFKLISSCTVAKEAWKILQTAYERTQKVRTSRLQYLTTRWETLRMEEDESITTYNSKIKDLANESFALGERMSNERFVRKVLRTFPKRFTHKVTAIEEAQDLSTMRRVVKIKRRKTLHELTSKNFNKTLKRFNKKPFSGGNNLGGFDKRTDKEEGSDNKVSNSVAFTARDTKEDVVTPTVNDCPIDTVSDKEEDLTQEELMANYQIMFMKWSKLTRAYTTGETKRDALMKKNHDLMKCVEQQKLEIRILEEKVQGMIKCIKMMNSSTTTLDEILLQGKRSG